MPEGKFVEVVDKNDKVTGKTKRSEVHKKVLLHRSVHIWVFDSKGRLFLQKRPKTMEYYPGFWDSSVGEHVEIGETYMQTALRGLKEELGVTGPKLKKVKKKVIVDKACAEMISLFVTRFDEKITPDKKELDGGKFFTLKQIQELVKKGKTTPFFNAFFKWYIDELKNTKNFA